MSQGLSIPGLLEMHHARVVLCILTGDPKNTSIVVVYKLVGDGLVMKTWLENRSPFLCLTGVSNTSNSFEID